MNRLTGRHSKNTSNSLEYSPSPRRDTSKITPGESPKPIIRIKSQQNNDNGAVNHQVFKYGGATQEEHLEILRNSQGFEFSPEVLVCDGAATMNLSLNETSPKN